MQRDQRLVSGSIESFRIFFSIISFFFKHNACLDLNCLKNTDISTKKKMYETTLSWLYNMVDIQNYFCQSFIPAIVDTN